MLYVALYNKIKEHETTKNNTKRQLAPKELNS